MESEISRLPSEIVLEGYSKALFAADEHGAGIGIKDSHAVRFCLCGALDRSVYEGRITTDQRDGLLAEARKITRSKTYWDLTIYSDSKGKEKVVAVLQKAEKILKIK